MNTAIKQCKDFLQETETRIEVNRVFPDTVSHWVPLAHQASPTYIVTLHNSKNLYSFFFWGKFNDLGFAVNPSVYDILSSFEIEYAKNFENFCSMNDYEGEPELAKHLYKMCKEQEKGLKKIWNKKQRLQLFYAIN